MKHFMVTFNRQEDSTISAEQIKVEQTHFKDLMIQGHLLNVNIDKKMEHFWLIFKASNKSEVSEIIHTLPTCKTLPKKIHELIWN